MSAVRVDACLCNFRSVRIGGQATTLLRAALAWAVQGAMVENDRDTADTTKSAGAMYGDFRAAREAAEEVGTHGRRGKQRGNVILSTVCFANFG